ncbi:MAG: SDR family oxidoreductase [Flavobacteriaceae bacterium]|nr:SDR family oxidoreductase [Flavobacteriaceae bacterium]
MKLLITGTTGYIAQRLLPMLHTDGHQFVCCVRDLKRIPSKLKQLSHIDFIEIDFLENQSTSLPKDIDAAYYFIHSMSTNSNEFDTLEQTCAKNFKALVETTNCKQVIYLSGISNASHLSKHLQSRLQVEQTLKSKRYALTVFRAGIIVGSGSASFEIIRDIVEKLPIMVAPKWLNTMSQPIAIRDVLEFLSKSLNFKLTYNRSFDIYGPEILSYKTMLLQFAEVRALKRYIFTLPVLTPRLSSYWLYFVTSTSFSLARALVDSMKAPIIAKPNTLQKELNITTLTYKEAVALAFQKTAQNAIISSWKDAISSGDFNSKLQVYMELPHFGCFKDIYVIPCNDERHTLEKIWSIGGHNGWYSNNYLWRLRGVIDKCFGGVGLRRGRKHPKELAAGDPLDFWRVIVADKKEKRLLLFAEMKLPGEAWLELKIVKHQLYSRAVFRPKGLLGRLYWFAVKPFHGLVFKGMLRALVTPKI